MAKTAGIWRACGAFSQAVLASEPYTSPSPLVRRETLKSRDKRPFFSPRDALQRNPSLCASLRNRLLFDIEAPEALALNDLETLPCDGLMARH